MTSGETMGLAATAWANANVFIGPYWQRLNDALLAPNSEISIFSLLSALTIAIVWTLARHGPVRPRVLWRAFFPRHWRIGASARADWGFALLNIFLTGSLIGWAIVSSGALATATEASLSHVFGRPELAGLPQWLAMTIVTLSVYLAYETAYYIDHYLSHHVPFLWHFHRTHHMAETLSPLTNFRVHPVDSLVFYNFVGLFIGISTGLTNYWLPQTTQFSLYGENIVLIAGLYLLTQLHHSHVWIAFGGNLGRAIMSPAHHQLHHSDNPEHFNRNFGNTLALFDWIAGTLLVPSRSRLRLTFGAGHYPVDPHGMTGGLIQPFVDAASSLAEHLPNRRSDTATVSVEQDLSFR